VGLFPLETVQPHAATAASATQAVCAAVRHLRKFYAWNCFQQCARLIEDLICAAEVTRIMVGGLDLHFMLQLEVVERMVARPSTPEYGRLSVTLQTRFRMRKLFRVSKGAFRPPPKVESAVVRLVPLAQPADFPQKDFEDIVRRAFSARRKTLRNALPGVDLAALGIDPKLRPENLSPEDYLRISRFVSAR